MKDAFKEYLGSLGIGAPFVQRVADIHDQCRVLMKPEFNDIFVSEQLVQGRRTYMAIHFFTDYHVLRCKNSSRHLPLR